MNNRLALMVLYLTGKGAINRTKLNKILFFADLGKFLEQSQTISGDVYRKLKFGPVPSSIEEVRKYLVQQGLMEMAVNARGPYIEYVYKAHLPEGKLAEIGASFGKDVIYLDKAHDTYSDMDAGVLSDLSHEFEPWKSGSMFDDLDMSRASSDQSLRKHMTDNGMLTTI